MKLDYLIIPITDRCRDFILAWGNFPLHRDGKVLVKERYLPQTISKFHDAKFVLGVDYEVVKED